MLHPFSLQSPEIALDTAQTIFASVGGMSATSFLHCSFLQAILPVNLWSSLAQTVAQASQDSRIVQLLIRRDRILSALHLDTGRWLAGYLDDNVFLLPALRERGDQCKGVDGRSEVWW